MANVSDYWKKRMQVLNHLEGDDWDREHELLAIDWKREYRREFERIAKERGWVRDVIAELCQTTVADAYSAFDIVDPTMAAEQMVEAIEAQP